MASSAATSYTKYLDKIKQKDPDVLLGSLIWYAVAESVRIKHADLVKLLEAAGLGNFIPPVPKDEDVFQRVATSHQRKRVETDNPDVYENYMIRTVKRGPDVFTKQIVVERVNGKGKKLGYNPAVQIEFTVSTGKVDIVPIGRSTNQQAENLADLIRKDFKAQRGHVNAYSVRELYRRIVGSTGATIVKPTGGIYFVLQSHATTVDGLTKLADSIDGVWFTSVSLLNTDQEQAMLRAAFEAETKDAVASRLEEIDKMLAGPEITSRRYADLIREMHALRGRTEEYRDLLDDKLADTELLLGSYEAKMKKLFLHTKGD